MSSKRFSTKRKQRTERRSCDRRRGLLRVGQTLLVEALESRRLLAFGVTQTTGGAASYVVDNGGDLKFSVLRNGATTSSTIHLGDITSIKYKSQEMLATYAVTSRYSHYEQGLGSGSTISYMVDNTNGWIMVKCDDSAATGGAVIHYYLVRRNDNNIYMASLPIDVNNGPGEGRFIAYLDRNVFTSPEAPSDLAGNTGAIEGSDVFGFADGTTASKFYNMGRRMIENEVHGLTGTAGATTVGAWMFMGNRERSAGGPFFKDIDFQAGSAVEIYNCIFTGHTQTEPYRQGLHTYAFQFTDGSQPVEPDYSWLENVKDAGGNLLISGLVPAAQRGAISGKATGSPAGEETVVALSNPNAQYWDMADAGGNYSITGVLPGTYTETLYSDELAVGTRTVTIAAGATTRADITSTYFRPTPTWRIGTWDGTPVGFLNSDKIEIMHPSDSRMSSWTTTPNFVVGADTDAEWPMVQFMGINNSQRITFNLTSAQATAAQTLRIGITLGFEGGRNRVTVNAGQAYAWTSSIPAASRDLNSRGITRGTWRGDNQLYTYNIPTSALRAGTNTIDLPVVSGSYVAGQTWLSPNVVYDAIDLVPTSALTSAPVVSSVTITPANSWAAPGGARQFTGVARDQFGNVTPANLDWSATRGTIDDTGAYIAPPTTGPDTITASSGAASGNTNINALADLQNLASYNADVSAGATLPDSSGNNLAANLSGSYSFVPGVNGNALKLSGGNATLPAGVVGMLNDFTIATWVKLDSLATWARIFDFGTAPASGNPQVYMFLTPQSGSGRPRFAITTTSNGGEEFVDSSVAMTSGAWTHVAVTLSGNTATLYINGVARGANNAITLRPSDLGGTNRNYIGASQWPDPALLGSIDDFRIYGRALSGAEVAALAGSTISGRAFHDTNASGALEAGEPALGGVQVYLDANNNSVRDAGELLTTATAGGDYVFSDVPAGSYSVREVAPANFVQSSVTVIAAGNGTSASVNLPNAQIVYNGTAAADQYTLRKNAGGKYEILIGGSLAYTVFGAAPSLAFNLLGGNDSLTLVSSNGAPVPVGGVQYDGGAQGDELSIALTAAADTIALNASSVTFGGVGAGTIQHANLDSVRFDGNGGWDTLTVNGGPAVTFADAQQLQSLALNGSAVAQFALGVAATVTRSLTVNDAAQVDLADTTMIVDTADPNAFADIAARIAAGYNIGAWDGAGIVTSRPAALAGLTTIGISTGEQVLGLGANDTDVFAGQTVSGRSVILKYTYAGDVNLDGVIDGGDYGVIDNFAQVPGASEYFNGDLNYDGVIDGGDYGIIDNNIQAQGPPL